MRIRTIAFIVVPLVVISVAASRLQSPVQEPSQRLQLLRANNLGIAWMDQLKFEEASKEFLKLTQIDPEFVPGWVNLGLAYLYLKDSSDKARNAFEKALELDPNQIQSHYAMGLLYRLENQPDKAIQAFTKVHEQDPEDPAANYYLGNLHFRHNRAFAVAIPFLKKAIELEPYNKSAYYNLALSYHRSGRREQGRRYMSEFRRLDRLSGTETIGQQYREQGRYAVAIDRIPERYLPRGAGSSPADLEVKFSEVAAESGLRFVHEGPGEVPRRVSSKDDLESRLVPALGSGLAIGDYDGDGWLDVYFANASSEGAEGALFRNRGDGTFEETTQRAGLKLSAKGMSALWGDIDNDGDLDLYLINYGRNRLYRNNGDGTFTDITESSGVGDESWGMSGAFVDADHDDDLDLVVANFADPDQIPQGGAEFPAGLKGSSNRLYRNNGPEKGEGPVTFSNASRPSQLSGGLGLSLGILPTDFDNSRDIDFYVANLGSSNQLFSNRRDGSFRNVARRFQAGGEPLDGSAAAVGDFDGDSRMDLVLADGSGKGSLLVNRGRKAFAATPLEGIIKDVHSALTLDFDNDGDLDLLLLSDRQGMQMLEWHAGGFRDVTARLGLDRFKGLPLRGGAVGDLDNDGDLDVLVNVNGSSPLYLRNEGGNSNNWISIEARGTNSNRFGYGTKVEIRSGEFHLKREVAGGHGLLSQGSSRVHFGLGPRRSVDFVRLRWPGGVLQSELDPPVNQKATVRELDRKGTSCPILYVWNGESYEFVTDFLGGSAHGYLLAPGQYNYPDTDEVLKLDRDQLRLRDGRVALTMNNQLEEVIFFDHVELIAVDHPGEYEVFPDEKLLPSPPYDEFRLLSVSQARPPAAARDGDGRDVLEEIKHKDRKYPDLFRELPFKGYATDHQLVLDLGETSAQRTLLLMHAWIDYADSSSNLAASQAGLKLKPPVLQVRDGQGQWRTVIERMGFPAGLPKTMTVDLSGKFLSSSREVRILTNMRIYWDQILVESGPERRDWRLHRLPATSAELGFHGFPEFYSPDGRQPKRYDYDRASPVGGWKVHTGAYTRFGDVRPLLEAVDDMYVITRSGDQIEVSFDVSHLPPLPQGWVRDYLVYVDGFGKDMDVNSAHSDTVEPLPFHGMSAFPLPAGESYPDTEAHRRYRREWNTRIEGSWIRP